MASKSLWLAGVALTVVAGTAEAQVPTEAPPVRETIDGNGVDLFRGKFVARQPLLSIGGSQGLTYDVIYRGAVSAVSVYGALDKSGDTITVNFEGRSDRFTLSGSTWVATESRGQTLTLSGNVYTYMSRDGTTVLFNRNYGNQVDGNTSGNEGRITQILTPTGASLTFAYQEAEYCQSGNLGPGAGPGGGGNLPNAALPNRPIEKGATEVGGGTDTTADTDTTAGTDTTADTDTDVTASTPTAACGDSVTVQRLTSVTNAYGYQLLLNYAAALPGSDLASWWRVASVTAKNLAGCAPDPSCTWPTLDLANAAATSNVAASTYTMGANGVTAMRRYGSTADDVTIRYTSGKVSSVSDALVKEDYAYADAGGVRSVTVTNRLAQSTTYTFDITSERMTSIADALGNKTVFAYDTRGRLKKTTYPRLNYIELVYDSEVAGKGNRGNVLEVRRVGRPGTPERAEAGWLVTKASFPTVCGFGVPTAACNKPATTTDALGRDTDYVYNDDGTLQKVTLPEPSSGAVRPQTRFTYQSLKAKVLGAGGALTDVGQPELTLLNTVSECRTGANCANGPDETRQITTYDTARNLLPYQWETKAGNDSLSAVTRATYDPIGNLIAINGPLPGTGDTMTFRYDQLRRRIGVISPDPDGAGPMKRRARKLTFGGDTFVDRIEAGTVVGTTDSDWTAFSSLQRVDYDYGSGGRVVGQTFAMDGKTHVVTHREYDIAGRIKCEAQRLDPATWETYTDGCTKQTSDGDDRIIRAYYDAAGRVIDVVSGLGTPEGGSEGSYTYTANGEIETAKDALLNQTHYDYDGHGRLVTTKYPRPSAPGQSNPDDYEELTWDKASNVTQRRLRDTRVISYSYDDLDRLTFKNRPNIGNNPDVRYEYDNQGRVTKATGAWPATITLVYDALGRLTSEDSGAAWMGKMSWEYDPAGRRTRQTWKDGFAIDYDYLLTSEMETIREAAGGFSLATYVYDDLGRRKTLTRGYSRAVTTYDYEAGGRDTPYLTRLFNDLRNTANDATTTFAYNNAGQIKSTTRDNDLYAWQGHYNVDRAYDVNGLNQLTKAGTTTLGYDERGNLKSSGAQTYSYTADNALSTAGLNTDLAHDAFERLMYVDAPGDQKVLLQRVNGEIATEIDKTTGSILRRYVAGAGMDEPLVWYEGSGTTDRRYIVADERGSVVAVTDGVGNATTINTYDEYGIPAPTNAGRFGYTGQAWFAGLGLYDYKARMYSPTLGRFMQTDPIGYAAGMNLYNYVGSDPINFVDPWGLQEQGQGDNEATAEGGDVVVTGHRPRQTGPSFDYNALSNTNGPNAEAAESQIDTMIDDIVVTAQRTTTVLRRTVSTTLNALRYTFDTIKLSFDQLHDIVLPPCCFTAGTMISTPTGLKAIETLNIGDLVISRSDKTGQTLAKSIVGITSEHKQSILTITISYRSDNGRWIDERYETTDDHPWRTADNRWVISASLKRGQVLARENGTAVVASIIDNGLTRPTYNLQIADFHTYFVGESKTWVHNSCAYIFKTSHYARRLQRAGISIKNAESAVRSALEAGGPRNGSVVVGGQTLLYRSYVLPNGTVSIGTIHLPW